MNELIQESYYQKNRDLLIKRSRGWKENNKEKVKKWREENREKILKKQKEWREKNKEKQKLAIKKWKEENPSKVKQIRDRFNQQNKAKVNKSSKIWRENNKEWFIKYNREYSFKRKQNDINFLISTSLRTRISQALKRGTKTGSAVKDLGCSMQQLISHLESKFTDGMSWDNYGINGWHIDHIVPLSYFDLTKEDDFLKACHYTNLQPLWAIDNLRKGAKMMV